MLDLSRNVSMLWDEEAWPGLEAYYSSSLVLSVRLFQHPVVPFISWEDVKALFPPSKGAGRGYECLGSKIS
jgi:hypothetical protein